MAAAKPSRSSKPATKAAAAKAAKPVGKTKPKPAAAKPAAKPAAKAKPAGLSADQQAKAAAATVRRIRAEDAKEKAARHEKALAERFERSRKVAEMHHAKRLGHLAGKAAAHGLTPTQLLAREVAVAQANAQQQQLRQQAAQQQQGQAQPQGPQ